MNDDPHSPPKQTPTYRRPVNKSKRPLPAQPPHKISLRGAIVVVTVYIGFFWAFIAIPMRGNNSWVLSTVPERIYTIALFGLCSLGVLACLSERRVGRVAIAVVVIMLIATAASFWICLRTQWTLIGEPH